MYICIRVCRLLYFTLYVVLCIIPSFQSSTFQYVVWVYMTIEFRAYPNHKINNIIHELHICIYAECFLFEFTLRIQM